MLLLRPKQLKLLQIPSKTKVAVKKDGTPDKRFKENKTTNVKPTGPVKKDGTPDMRYKTNKDTTKVKIVIITLYNKKRFPVFGKPFFIYPLKTGQH